MKIVLWIGNEANQKALANKIYELIPIAGIITETRKNRVRLTFPTLLSKAIEKLFFSSIGKAWKGMHEFYNKKYIEYPTTSIINVENINDEAAYIFTNNIKPDLIIVSGTRMIKEKMLSIKPGIGIINLHTGLSPYIKGGPNCTNWCISTKAYHLIGNTVMWIDAGIDSGNIIATEFTKFTGEENLLDIHIKVMEHAHSLYLKAIGKLSEGKFLNVNQADIDNGKTYYTKQWTLHQKINLVKNLHEFQENTRSGKIEKLQEDVKTIEI